MTIVLPDVPQFNGSVDVSLGECKIYLECIEKYLNSDEINNHDSLDQLSDQLGNVISTIDTLDDHIFNLEVHNDVSQDMTTEIIASYSGQLDDLRTIASNLEEKIDQAILSYAENLKNLGNISFKECDYHTAFLKYEEASSINPNDVVYFTNAALSLQKLERWLESITYANRAVSLDSNYLKAYVIRTKSYLSMDDVKQASSSFHEIPTTYESQHDVLELKQAISVKAKEAGNQFFKQSSYDQALALYTMAIEYDDENHLLYSNRSACYQAKRSWKAGKEDALQVIELNDKFAKGYIHLIRCQIQLGEYDHAMVSYNDACAKLSSLPDWDTVNPQFIELGNTIKSAKAAATARTSASDKARGESLKTRGNQMYQSGEYQDAIRMYSQAIGACPEEGVYYGNRAACWMMLKEYQQASNDCTQGLTLEKSPGELDKLRLRMVDAYVHMGKVTEATNYIDEYNRKRKDGEDIAWFVGSTSFQEKHTQLQSIKTNMENARLALENKEYSRCKRLYQQVQQAGVSEDVQMLINLAKAHVGLKELDDAGKFSQQAITIMTTRGGMKNIEAYMIRGEVLAGQGMTEQACKYISAAVQLDPDNVNASQRLKALRKVHTDTMDVRKRIAEAMGERKYEVAISACSDGLNIDRSCLKVMAEMHYKRAQAYQQQGKGQTRATASSDVAELPHIASFKKCYQDANSALYYDKAMISAFYLKIDALQALNRHEEAVAELEQLTSEKEYRKDEEAHEKLKQAKLLLKRSKRKDLYTTLMVERGSLATDEEIKKAYKKAALKWHPDRHSGSTEEKKKEAESKFKEIQSAFELLTDPQKKRLYDQGYDEEEIDQKLEMEKQYAGGGGGGGGFGGGGFGGFGGGGGYHSHGRGGGHYGFH